MKYIRISNKVDSGVNRVYIEKMGISTKRDDPMTIGQFGSGSVLAPIAALRNGWQFVFAGEDDKGSYIMEYVTHNDGQFDHVMYQYTDADGNISFKPSSFTLDCGVLSWNEDFQIFREALSNAIDEKISKDVEFDIEYVDSIEVVPGHFCVYLTADPRLMEFVDNFDLYFKINAEPDFVINDIKIFKKDAPSPLRVFCKGIMVYCADDTDYGYTPSKMDYQIDDIKLNEERRLQNVYTVEGYVSRLFVNPTLPFAATVIAMAISPDLTWEGKFFEGNIHDNWDGNELYKIAWANLMYDDIVIIPHLDDPRMRKLAGIELDCRNKREQVIKSPFLYKVLQLSGIDNYVSIIGKPLDLHIVEPEGIQKENLDRAMKIVAYFDSAIKDVPIYFFEPSVSQTQFNGIYRDGNIYISNQKADSVERLVRTLVHELDHHLSGLSDDDRQFRSVADARIAALMVSQYMSREDK